MKKRKGRGGDNLSLISVPKFTLASWFSSPSLTSTTENRSARINSCLPSVSFSGTASEESCCSAPRRGRQPKQFQSQCGKCCCSLVIWNHTLLLLLSGNGSDSLADADAIPEFLHFGSSNDLILLCLRLPLFSLYLPL